MSDGSGTAKELRMRMLSEDGRSSEGVTRGFCSRFESNYDVGHSWQRCIAIAPFNSSS